MVKKLFRWTLVLLGIIILIGGAYLLTLSPSHDRVWELGHDELPRIDIVDDEVTITNLRDFAWTGPFEAEPNYITDTFRLSELETVDVVISHFDDFEGLAHIFLSFGFADERYVSVSVETRRETHETYSPLRGLFRQYELIYVVGTDRDVIGVRTGPRDERVYLYRVNALPEQVQEFFTLLAERINHIADTPVFYNTLFTNCTNEITRRVERVSDVRFPRTYKLLFPGYFHEMLHGMEMIPTLDSVEETKARARVDNAVADPSDADYATRIRRSIGIGVEE
jgi:hypothetical protein